MADEIQSFSGFGRLGKAAGEVLGAGADAILPAQVEQVIDAIRRIDDLMGPLTEAVELMQTFREVAASLVKLAAAADDLARIGKSVAEVVEPLGKRAAEITDALEPVAKSIGEVTRRL